MPPPTHAGLPAATAAHAAGRLADAERAYRRILGDEPANAEALHGLGVLCHQTGRASEACKLLQMALALSPAWGGCRNSLAGVLAAQGRHAEAAELLNEAARLEPRSAPIHVNLGAALERTGRLPDAVAVYQTALELDPGHALAYIRLAGAQRGLGRMADSEATLRDAVRRRPDYAPAYKDLAATLAELGRPDEVAAWLRKLSELQPRPRPRPAGPVPAQIHSVDPPSLKLRVHQTFKYHITVTTADGTPINGVTVKAELNAGDGRYLSVDEEYNTQVVSGVLTVEAITETHNDPKSGPGIIVFDIEGLEPTKKTYVDFEATSFNGKRTDYIHGSVPVCVED